MLEKRHFTNFVSKIVGYLKTVSNLAITVVMQEEVWAGFMTLFILKY